jgi:cytoskeleton protein RodZ
MSDETGLSPSAVTEEVATGPSAGTLLRQAREADGIHISELALALKVSAKKIEALEADRLELLPDAVFARALASAVCRALKIDPAPILERLPQSAVPRLELDGAGLNTPFQSPGYMVGSSIWNQFSKPVMLVALVLLVGALVLIFFPTMDHVLGAISSPSPADSAALDKPAMADEAVPATPVALPEPVSTAAAPKPQASKPAVVAAIPAPAKVASSPVPALIKAPTVQTVATPAQGPASVPLVTPVQGKSTSSGIIVFKTQGPSWIEVTDGDGSVQIRRTIQEGEVVGVSGPLPLSVVIGRADMTEVSVRGKAFSLDSITRDNVARFEVK